MSGQATVELVALLPLVVIVALAVFAVLAAGSARERAAAAAHAGAMALLQQGDPEAAAMDALGGAQGRVEVSGSRVTVRVSPRLPVPVIARRLAATARADAGLHRPKEAAHLRGGDGESADPGRAERFVPRGAAGAREAEPVDPVVAP